MTTILERPRPKAQPGLPAAPIREACLIGDPSRRYLRLPIEPAEVRDRTTRTRPT